MIKRIIKRQVFFIQVSFKMTFLVLFLRKCLLQFLCYLVCYLILQEKVQTDVLRCSSKQVFIKISQYVLKPLFSKVSGLKACIFIQKETPTQVFFFKYCEIFRNGFFIEDLFIYLSEILFDDRQLIFQSYILLL